MLDQIKEKSIKIDKLIEELRGYLEVDKKKQIIDELSIKMSHPSFWQNDVEANQIVAQLKSLKNTIQPWQDIYDKFKELKELVGIIKEEDTSLIKEINIELERLLKKIDELEFVTLLGEEFDKNNAVLSINAGAGGVEACDWAGMLLRMYLRYAEDKGYVAKTIDILAGEEAGIKNVTVLIEGEYAYGQLKSERGVHRLVRISPFDANKRRHTSFASVDVIPEIKEDINIDIPEKDLKIEAFRSSGPGGQHMQKSDTAVRITHLPSGIVVSCQNERSQYQNKQTALKILKARLYQLERQKKEEELTRKVGAVKQKIEWGSQIRSYVMHPYNLVKDHRTDFQTSDVDAVMDGKIDDFIEAYLKANLKSRC
ncbi:MAG: peptide chain release factor 2 [Candidatus Omnitrophica bacterium]|nr:peptide chain release factor 2 [Candidatus Omnitrophota bacterium]